MEQLTMGIQVHWSQGQGRSEEMHPLAVLASKLSEPDHQPLTKRTACATDQNRHRYSERLMHPNPGLPLGRKIA